MYRMWMYVFCSVVVRACLGTRVSLGKLTTTKDITPSTVGIYNETEQTVTHRSLVISDVLQLSPLNIGFNSTEIMAPLTTPFTFDDVCYEVLGCFSLAVPWSSILRPSGIPMNPEKMQVTVDFFTRLSDHLSIKLYPDFDLGNITFASERPTVLIVHGFASSGEEDWLKELKNAYLRARDANVFTVDWGRGARDGSYLQVMGNTRVVGKELAILIKKLIEEFRAKAEDFHLIGHSLGAHICSYAAKEVEGIGRLTALDPAQPGFEGFSKEVRLEKNDAKFVEVLHTDARPFIPTVGFGMIAPHGHVDYYFNGGFSQPGCLLSAPPIRVYSLASLGKYPAEFLAEIVNCPHSRAYKYFIEALDDNKCTFWGSKVRIVNTLEVTMNFLTHGFVQLPTFRKCTPEECIPLGLDAINSPHRGSFLVTTRNSSPFCKS